MHSSTVIVPRNNPYFRSPLSYRRLHEAILYYTDIGYEYVEVPWAVPRFFLEATCPDPDNVSYIDGLGLVGSAEQAFLALVDSGMLPKGRYVACTPCFRNGDDDGELHQPAFMKVELFRTDFVDHHAVNEIILEAMEFFQQQLSKVEYCLNRAYDQRMSCDINLNGVEIGSYGAREWNGLHWVYGTGVAEPRFSMAMTRDPADDPVWREFSDELCNA